MKSVANCFNDQASHEGFDSIVHYKKIAHASYGNAMGMMLSIHEVFLVLLIILLFSGNFLSHQSIFM